uniref:DUF975 family protein n=1 Tax=uncultured bacterium Contig575 TaxID=1393592 RepID=W0FLP5_9BACT|nr:hypothetical protein [uncultured bacterium Contig575]
MTMTCSRRDAKRQARGHVKRHYMLLVVLCAVSIFLGTEFTNVVSNAQVWYDSLTGQVTRLDTDGIREEKSGNSKFLDDLIADNLEAGREEAAARIQALQAQTDPRSVLGRQRGVLAALANGVNSGHLYATMGTAIHSIVHSQQVVAAILILLTAAFYAVVWVFLRNMYRAVLRRAFLETRLYGRYPLNHLLHFRLVKRWVRTSLTLLLQEVFLNLWSLTIVGGFIKHYSYFLVPFIAAENPDIRPREAITLSRRMMDGHKWEFFRLELSFIGWRILGFVSFGAVDALWSVPYEMATFAEYYAALRQEAKRREIPGAERLNDDCLFEKADEQTLRQRYANITRIEGVLEDDIVALPPVQRFFAKNFGIWLGSLDEKRIYTRQEGLRQQARIGWAEMNGEAYPQRMNPLWNREATAITGRVSYLTPCTVWSLVAVFFSFCLIGWVWEVSLHLISDGEFVNRGALHGPWLPIYGGGVVMIAVLLYRFRKKPALEAVLVVVLCGIVEYLTSYFMELSKGMRWWDYTGYFLNLNGRICGEGLAVFAVGGMAAIYLLVPIIDAAITRVRSKIVIPICVALLICFAGDLVYSHFVPNTGKGITDYEQVNAIQESAAVEDVAFRDERVQRATLL